MAAKSKVALGLVEEKSGAWRARIPSTSFRRIASASRRYWASIAALESCAGSTVGVAAIRPTRLVANRMWAHRGVVNGPPWGSRCDNAGRGTVARGGDRALV